ncbi:hypothetical protein ABZT03_04240 [Streptomyces sp. NPDC005574]|uniref:hypothetical protein n=1 Tax=Streptomyces sp. NPDC005574 TaxID=3156891 RepID=UPI0033BC74BC
MSRTILLLDIEKYSDRDDVEQAYLRRVLYDITDRALEHAGIDETLRLRADRGDSVMELIDANASVTALLRSLLTEVPAQLHGYNRIAAGSARIRLRGVVATGYVAVDEHGGWVGADLNHACRLLDAQLLRAALRERASGFALCVSEGVHAGIVRHDHHGVPAAEFHRVTPASKNGPLPAWLHGPVPAGFETGAGGGEPAESGGRGSGGPGAVAPGSTGAAAAGSTAAEGALVASPPTESAGAEPAVARPRESAAGRPAAVSTPAPAAAPAPLQPPAPTPSPGPVFNFGSGSPRFGGALVAGDQHGVSGGQVTGDVHLGGTAGEES